MRNLIARMIGLDDEMRLLEIKLANAEHSRDYHKQREAHQKARADFYRQEQAEARTHLVNAKRVMGLNHSGPSAARTQIYKAMDRLGGRKGEQV